MPPEAEAAPAAAAALPAAERGPAAAAAAAVADLSSTDEALCAQAAIAVCLFCSREEPPPGLLPAVRARCPRAARQAIRVQGFAAVLLHAACAALMRAPALVRARRAGAGAGGAAALVQRQPAGARLARCGACSGGAAADAFCFSSLPRACGRLLLTWHA
jgi:hypothetical protein